MRTVRIFFLAVLTLAFGVLGVPAGFAAPAGGQVVTDDGVRLHYVEMGSGNDVLVAPAALYLEPFLLQPLSTNRRVIFYDPRNRGRSEAADLTTVSLDRQVEDLENLRDSLGLEQMALLGFSGLGMEMAVYALRYPHRVSRLIQVAAVPPAASIMARAGDARNERGDREAVEALDARADAGAFDDRPGEYCRLRNALTDPTNFADPALAVKVPDVCAYQNEWPKNLWPYFGALLPSFGDYDWRPGLAELDVPRLVIHGREDGIPLAGAVAWVAGFQQSRLLVVTPSGHFPFIEQSERTLLAINTFLDGQWPPGAAPVPAGEEASEVVLMLHEFLAGASHNDPAAHDRFWADDLVYTSSAGERFGKAAIMAGFEPAAETSDAADGAAGHGAVTYRAEDVDIRVFDDTAVVAFRLIGDREDQAPEEQYFNTGTFLRRDGEWRVAAWQATRIP